MKVDTLRLSFTYAICFVLIVGGGAMLFAIRLDPPDSGSATLSLAVVGFIGAAVQWAFGRETATQATRAAQSSSAAGAAQSTPTPELGQ